MMKIFNLLMHRDTARQHLNSYELCDTGNDELNEIFSAISELWLSQISVLHYYFF